MCWWRLEPPDQDHARQPRVRGAGGHPSLLLPNHVRLCQVDHLVRPTAEHGLHEIEAKPTRQVPCDGRRQRRLLPVRHHVCE